MDDTPQEHKRASFVISTDRTRLDLEATLRLLHTTRWAETLTPQALERAAANSVCFGVYADERQMGFGRVVSDLATYAYLTDFVIEESYRGQGLGKWLVKCVLSHPDFQHLRRMALVTMNAQKLYEPFGFTKGLGSLVYMERRGSGDDTL